MPEIKVPFTSEEVDRLQDMAAREGGTVADYVRLRLFGPIGAAADPVTILAGREMERMRDQAAAHFYDRMIEALQRTRRRDI